MFAFYLIRQPVSDGPIPYHGSFGGGTTGHLVSIANPGANAFGPGSVGWPPLTANGREIPDPSEREPRSLQLIFELAP